MAESVNPPNPEEPGLTAGHDDVERLLAEAETLADQIAQGAETTRDVDRAAAAGGAGDGGPEGVLAATDEVERTLTELEGLVGGVQHPDGTTPAATPSPGRPSSIRGRHASADGELGSPSAATAEAGLDQLGEAKAVHPSPAGVEDQQEPQPENPSLPAILAAAGRRTGRAVARVASALARAVWRMFILIDRPFAGLSEKTRQHVGLVAIITLLAALAAFVLPSLLQHNPYLRIRD
jgi:hypothetical protein